MVVPPNTQSGQWRDLDYIRFYMFSQHVPFSATNDEKHNSSISFRDRADIRYILPNHEFCGVEIRWAGHISNNPININIKFFDNDTNRLLYEGNETMPTPESEGWDWWEWYRMRFWIGRVEHEIRGAMIIRAEITGSGDMDFTGTATHYFEVYDTTPTPPPSEYPKQISDGVIIFTVHNAAEEIQMKEFLGIDPPGETINIYLATKTATELDSWKAYWTDIWNGLGRTDMSFYTNEMYNIHYDKLPPTPPSEYPMEIGRGAHIFTVYNAAQEANMKEMLGIEPPGDDVDTYLSKLTQPELNTWKAYWVPRWLGQTDKLRWITGMYNKYYPDAPPEPPEEPTWWEKLLDLITIPEQLTLLVSRELFQAAYKLVTGRDMSDAEYESHRLEIADWILPINLASKLFTGKNLKGEYEEFGSATDWFETILMAGLVAIPGPADDIAAKFALKSISKTEAAALVDKLGAKATIDQLVKVVKANPETSAKFLSKFPSAVRSAVINGLGRNAYGREVIYILGKQGYFKYTAPGLKGFLAKTTLTPTWFKLIAGTLAGYLTFANFLAWTGKEALVETLSFPIWALIEAEDWQGVLDHVDALRESIRAADAAMILTEPIPLVRDIWNQYIINANSQADTYEKIAQDALAEIEHRGTLTITPTPSDAKVSVVGQIPTTGVFSKELPVGSYSYVVSKFNYESKSGTAEVIEGITTDITVEINVIPKPPPEKAILNIFVEPADAILTVAGHPEINMMGTYEVDEGTYLIRASKEGFYDRSITAIAKAGETREISIILTEIPPEPPEEIGILVIISEPAEVAVEIAGHPEIIETGTYELPTGMYTVKITKEGFYDKYATAIIKTLQTTTISITLTEKPEVPPPEEIIEVPMERLEAPYNAWKYTLKAVDIETKEALHADIYIDGVSIEHYTPWSIYLFPDTKYILQLERWGYKPAFVEINTLALPE